ncbi:MAG: hypothetical protein WD069_11160 [Planctomycetales bacterium]
MLRLIAVVACLALVRPAAGKETAPADVQKAAEAITAAATAPAFGQKGAGHPLPLAGHWNTGAIPGGFTPNWQLEQIEAGHMLLPWFDMPNIEPTYHQTDAYYESAIKRAAELKLPLTFVGTQWEHLLTTDPEYFGLPAERNPNSIYASGQVNRAVCPFGPVEPWRQVGRQWTTSPMIRKVQEWYPDPPRVIFLSNNEHTRLTWNRVEGSPRYLARFGKGRDDDFKRKVVGDGWIERYRALQSAMRDGLAEAKAPAGPAWSKAATFVGYDAFGPPHLGRWGGWPEYSLHTKERIDPNPLMWDGGSPSFYVPNWNGSTDHTVWSPQIESMNWPFMLDEARRLNPAFWWEISTWDGHQPTLANDKRKTYAAAGQTFSPERYGGMIQFGMWLLRPRVVREYRNHTDTVEKAGAYFEPIMAAVDRVHRDATLREFWQRGALVPNRAAKHPYQELVPEEYRDRDRWFLLETSLTPERPWKLDTKIEVFAVALALGEKPARRWLVYAHAPLGARDDVSITLPEFGDVTADVPVAGGFWLVREKGREVTPLPATPR